MSKFSSFKNHQLITENWRKFLNEGLYDVGYESAIDKVNALWSKLNDEGHLQPLSAAELAAAARLEGGEEGLLDELGGLEIGGVYWYQSDEDEFTPITPDEQAAQAGRPRRE